MAASKAAMKMVQEGHASSCHIPDAYKSHPDRNYQEQSADNGMSCAGFD